MGFRDVDTRGQRRTGTLLAYLGSLLLAAGLLRTAFLVAAGYAWPAILIQAVLFAFLVLGFGGSGLSLLREARTRDLGAALRMAQGLRRRAAGAA